MGDTRIPAYTSLLINVTPDDVLHGRREDILIKRREVKAQTLASRKRYNRLLRESNNTAISPDLSFTKVSHFCWLPTQSRVRAHFSEYEVMSGRGQQLPGWRVLNQQHWDISGSDLAETRDLYHLFNTPRTITKRPS